MGSHVLADSSFLVALVNRCDARHRWAVEISREADAPFLTCEAVLSESWFLLSHARNGPEGLLRLLRLGGLAMIDAWEGDSTALAGMLAKYADVPMSIADATLVRLSEQYTGARVATLDGDFSVYRRHRRERIPMFDR
jgi:predicted nucleic acid-binding protein